MTFTKSGHIGASFLINSRLKSWANDRALNDDSVANDKKRYFSSMALSVNLLARCKRRNQHIIKLNVEREVGHHGVYTWNVEPGIKPIGCFAGNISPLLKVTASSLLPPQKRDGQQQGQLNLIIPSTFQASERNGNNLTSGFGSLLHSFYNFADYVVALGMNDVLSRIVSVANLKINTHLSSTDACEHPLP